MNPHFLKRSRLARYFQPTLFKIVSRVSLESFIKDPNSENAVTETASHEKM
jgi:hypothetical protein